MARQFNQEQFDFIIGFIEDGNSLRAALREPNTPSSQTFYIWLQEDAERAKRYAYACDERADQMFEEILEIADKQDADVYLDAEGKEVTDHNVIQRSRLQVDTRKWMLAKMNPKKYSEKSQIDIDLNDQRDITITRKVISERD